MDHKIWTESVLLCRIQWSGVRWEVLTYLRLSVLLSLPSSMAATQLKMTAQRMLGTTLLPLLCAGPMLEWTRGNPFLTALALRANSAPLRCPCRRRRQEIEQTSRSVMTQTAALLQTTPRAHWKAHQLKDFRSHPLRFGVWTRVWPQPFNSTHCVSLFQPEWVSLLFLLLTPVLQHIWGWAFEPGQSCTNVHASVCTEKLL